MKQRYENKKGPERQEEVTLRGSKKRSVLRCFKALIPYLYDKADFDLLLYDMKKMYEEECHDS